MLQYSMSLGHCLVSWHFLNPCWNPLTIYNTSDAFVNLFWNPYATFDTSDTTVLWTLTDIQGLEFDFLIFKKDWSWSNRSRRSLKKIELLLSISEKDQKGRIVLTDLWKRLKRWHGFNQSLKRSKRSNRSQKASDLLEKNVFFVCFFTVFPLFMAKDRRERFVLFAIELIFWSQKTMDSIKKLMIKFPTLIKCHWSCTATFSASS